MDYAVANDKDGPLSDILDVISKGKCDFLFFHDADYWAQEGNKEKKIFANLIPWKSCRIPKNCAVSKQVPGYFGGLPNIAGAKKGSGVFVNRVDAEIICKKENMDLLK